MRRKQNEKDLVIINWKTVYVLFEDTTWVNESCDSAEAIYFGQIIRISFPNAITKKVDDEECFTTYAAEVYPLDEEGIHTYLENQDGCTEFQSLSEMIAVVNRYIRSRPFTIKQPFKGKFLLFDPNGNKHCGKYLSLEKAQNFSDHNFEMEPSGKKSI